MRIQKGGRVSELLGGVPVPAFFPALQTFPGGAIPPERIPEVIFEELAREPFLGKVQPGMRIAITAGSRGIRHVDVITRAIVDFVKWRGARPFIVPAMGSHGGATAEGQRAILAGYGITEETMGCEVRSSMETVTLGLSGRGKPVYMDKNAWESDGVIVSCRLKPHNAFRGRVESGPCKMMAVGLGKQKGASLVHEDGMEHIAENIQAMAETVLRSGKILFALPCIENAGDETMKLEAIPPERILEREPELLKLAFANMPRILVGEGDVLIVDEIGKNYSGTGVDPNVTGTFSTPFASGGVKVQRTCFLRLSGVSHGNGLGVGLASAITKRIFDELDAEMMYPNCITSTVLASARIPCVTASDREAIQLCILTCNGIDREHPRVIRIPNSLHLERILLSEAYFEDVRAGRYPGLEAVGEPRAPVFDEEGNLEPM